MGGYITLEKNGYHQLKVISINHGHEPRDQKGMWPFLELVLVTPFIMGMGKGHSKSLYFFVTPT